MKESFNDRIALAADMSAATSINRDDMVREMHKLKLQNKKMRSFIQRWINSVDASHAWDQKELSKECGDFISRLEICMTPSKRTKPTDGLFHESTRPTTARQ